VKLLIILHHRFTMWKAPTWFSERLHKEFPQLEVVHLSSYDDLEADLRDAEIAIAWSIRPEQFKIATKLRWIHSPAAAVHQLIFPELLNSAVILTNSSQVHGPVVAEHVIALLFALAKRLPDAFRFQEKHIWGQEPMWRGRPRPRELAGATLGLVGLGSIGREVAKRASALGMHVVATREHPEKGSPENVENIFSSSQIDALLSKTV
jgi:phosphoglycerate dehydrogenase-like enzyme